MPGRFYIVGCQRTGTTLMKLVLECHSQVRCYDEHLAYQILSGQRPTQPSPNAMTGFKVPRLTEQFGAATCMDHDLPPFPNPYAGEPLVFMLRDVRDTVASMINLAHRGRRWLDVWGVPSFEHKMARDEELWALYAPLLHEFEGHEDYVLVQAALYWRYKTEACDDYMRRGYPLLPVSYDHLVADPETALSQVCDVLDLSWEPALLDHHRRPHSEIWRTGLAIGGTDPRRAIDCRSIHAWRRTFTPSQVASIMTAAGPVQHRLFPDAPSTPNRGTTV